MGRRLTLAMVLVVAGALLFAGLGSLLLVRRSTLDSEVSSLTSQANSIATALSRRESAGAGAARLLDDACLIAKVTSPFVARADFVVVSPGGTSVTALPETGCGIATTSADSVLLQLARSDLAAVVSGEIESGTSGTRAFAVAPLQLSASMLASIGQPSGSTLAIALLADVHLPGDPVLYFLVAAAICLVVAGLVAGLFAARLTRPLALAVRTTRRIAAGDLDARVPSTRTHPELVQLGESINAMAEELARARARERQFVLSISHDLRTPLTSIRGYAEAIADGAAPDPAGAANVIAAEAGRLERLFQDLLDLARLDTRRFTIDVRRVDLREVVDAAAEGLRIRFEEAGLQLVVDRSGVELPVAADPDRLAQVLINLLENARKFARGATRVATVPDPTAPEMIALLVEDDGPGIPPADLPHVFERFYTGAVRDRAGTGSGLGLAIVTELVQAMGGTVAAVSPAAAGRGTRIVVRLRRWSGGEERQPPPPPPPPAPPPAGGAGGAPAAPGAAHPR